MTAATALFLADAVLVLHAAFAAFMILGFAYTCIGGLRGWPSAKNRTFRTLHLAGMGFVLVETLLGYLCPLTQWEYQLRVLAGHAGRYDTTFIDHWVGGLLYTSFPLWAYGVAYGAFFGLLLLAWKLVPPRKRPDTKQAG